MCAVDASKQTIWVHEPQSMDVPAPVVIFGEAALQEARDVARQIEQRVHEAMGDELPPAG